MQQIVISNVFCLCFVLSWLGSIIQMTAFALWWSMLAAVLRHVGLVDDSLIDDDIVCPRRSPPSQLCMFITWCVCGRQLHCHYSIVLVANHRKLVDIRAGHGIVLFFEVHVPKHRCQCLFIVALQKRLFW